MDGRKKKSPAGLATGGALYLCNQGLRAELPAEVVVMWRRLPCENGVPLDEHP
jgi:hypothetical protein